MISPTLEELFNAHFRSAAYVAEEIVHSKSAAEDIVQDVFVKLARVDLSKIDSPTKYLYRCVRNAALDYEYTGDSEYEYKGDLSYNSGDIVAVYGPEYGEIMQEIIGMIESGDTAGASAKIGELKDIKDDYVRYMGALHWQGTGVSFVAWNGTTYTWDDSLTMKGSRWTSENGTLSANINTYIIGQYLAGNFTLQISMELSNGAEKEMFTYSVQFEEAPAPEVQYFDVTLSGEGVAFYIDGLRYDAGTYAFTEGEHRISIEVLYGYEGTPSISNVEGGMFTVSGEMTIEVTGISAVETPVKAPSLSVVLPGRSTSPSHPTGSTATTCSPSTRPMPQMEPTLYGTSRTQAAWQASLSSSATETSSVLRTPDTPTPTEPQAVSGSSSTPREPMCSQSPWSMRMTPARSSAPR